MWRYLGRRLIQVPLVLLVVSLMTFLITRATSGDPVQIMLGMQTSPEAAAAMRAEFNLDRSVPEQYFLWLGEGFDGGLGGALGPEDPGGGRPSGRVPLSPPPFLHAHGLPPPWCSPPGVVAAPRAAHGVAY